MLAKIKIRPYDTDRIIGDLLPKIFYEYFLDFKFKIKKLIEKYTPGRLHDTRVAARRFQAIFIGFDVLLKKFGKENKTQQYKFIVNSIEKIIKILGTPREREVSYNIAYQQIKNQKDGEQLNLMLLLSDLRLKKIESIESLYSDKYFLKYNSVLKKIDNYIGKKMFGNMPQRISITVFREIYFKITSYHLNTFIKFILNLNPVDGNLNSESESKNLHKLRIKTKTLRYLLDMCSGVFSEEFENIRTDIKRIIEKLGEYHDVNVVIKYSEKYLILSLKQTGQSSKSIIKLIQDLMKKKNNLFTEIYSLLSKTDSSTIELFQKAILS